MCVSAIFFKDLNQHRKTSTLQTKTFSRVLKDFPQKPKDFLHACKDLPWNQKDLNWSSWHLYPLLAILSLDVRWHEFVMCLYERISELSPLFKSWELLFKKRKISILEAIITAAHRAFGLCVFCVLLSLYCTWSSNPRLHPCSTRQEQRGAKSNVWKCTRMPETAEARRKCSCARARSCSNTG